AFLGGARHGDRVELPESELVARTFADLRELLGIRGEPRRTLVTVMRESMPQYELGHLERVEEIERRVSALTGLTVAGNAYRGVGLPDCIRSANEAVRAVSAQLA